jgi:hypothetical protein
MPPETFDIELNESLRKLRLIAEMRARTCVPLGDLIGAGEVSPLVVEVRMAPPGYGWLMRMQESGGVWVDVPESTWCDYSDVKLRLSVSMPMHLCIWYEEGGDYAWADC